MKLTTLPPILLAALSSTALAQATPQPTRAAPPVVAAPVVVALAAPSTAAPGVATAPPPAAPGVEANGVDEAQLTDASVGRTFLMPTAEILPAGGLTVQGTGLGITRHDILAGVGLTVGVTPMFQLSGSGLAIDGLSMASGTAKARVARHGHGRLAVQASASYVQDEIFSDNVSTTVLSGGPVASICLEEGCQSMLSIAAIGLVALEKGSTPLFAGGLSWLQRVSPAVKLMVEGVLLADSEESEPVVTYGARLTPGPLSLDLGLMLPQNADPDFPAGFPFVDLALRVK